MPVSVFFTTTVTPGSTAPVESVTVPVRVPRGSCAAAVPAVAHKTDATTRVHIVLRENIRASSLFRWIQGHQRHEVIPLGSNECQLVSSLAQVSRQGMRDEGR